MEYIQGNAVTCFEQFLNAAQEPADPTTITFYVRDPAGAVTAYVFGVDPEVTHPPNPDPDSPYFGSAIGYYELDLGAPTMVGEWHYRPAGTGALTAANEYEFTILPSSTLAPFSDGPQYGPFTEWCDPQDVIELCEGAVGSDTGLLDSFCRQASEVLFELGGRQHAGLSQPVTVRPSGGGCGCWPWSETWHSWGQVAGGIWTWDWGLGRWGCGPVSVGCQPLSEVKLAGYPVRQIVQVKINGDILDPTLYRIDRDRFLVRLRDVDEPNVQLWWPGCQIRDLPDTEDGTFAVTYRYGADPPEMGKAAAAALACELWRATPAGGGECQLPAGARRAVRQNLTVDISLFAQWTRDPTTGAWAVGIPAVDTYLNTYNPGGLRRTASVSSPWVAPYPLRPGV